MRYLLYFCFVGICLAVLSPEEHAARNEVYWEARRNPTKPIGLRQSENAFIVLCNANFADNNNQKRSVAEFTQIVEQRKAEARNVMVTNQVLGLTMLLDASELIHRAVGSILEVKNEAARWRNCPYDTNAAWDYIEWHEEVE